MTRRRAHIAMVGIPAVSHVLPSLDIIRELVARGHRVSYANGTAVADLVAAAGAELVPCTSTLPVADGNWSDDPSAALDPFLGNAASTPWTPPPRPCGAPWATSSPTRRSPAARRSARLRADVRAEGGTTRAADLIEQMLNCPPCG